MTISNNSVMQVDGTAGDDALNSGFYNAAGAGAGTDFSIISPLSCTDLAVDATTNTIVRSSSIGFATAHQRNGLRITAGAGFTAGLYEIVSVSAGAATLDRSPGAVGITGGTARVGGALASLGGLGALIGSTSNHLAYLKYQAAAYNCSATANVPGGNYNAASISIVGYDTTRTLFNTDANQPTLNCTATSGWMITMSATGVARLRNLILDNSGSVGNQGHASLAGGPIEVARCTFRRSTWTALTMGAYSQVSDCLFDACTANPTLIAQAQMTLARCWFKNCTGPNAISLAVPGVNPTYSIEDVLVTGYTGVGAAIAVGTAVAHVVKMSRVTVQCTGANNHVPIDFNPGVAMQADLSWCIAIGGRGGTGYGFRAPFAGGRTRLFNCAGWDNAQGDYSIASGEVVGFVALSANPLAADFTLNTTAGGGAACRGIGYTYPGSSTITYPSIGAATSAAAAAGVGPVIGSGFIRGIGAVA